MNIGGQQGPGLLKYPVNAAERKRSERARLISILVMASLLAVLLWGALPVSASVTLLYFEADSEDGSVLLRWETATEFQNIGFFIQRSSSQEGSYERISPFIVAEGDDLTGAQYSYRDTEVTNGTTYWYQLEAISADQSSEYYGPVPATPGIDPTATSEATPTETPTPTLTPTATEQGAISTATVTATATATSTGTQATATMTPTRTSTSIITPTRTRTPTSTSLPASSLPSATGSVGYPAPVTNTPLAPSATALATDSGTPTISASEVSTQTIMGGMSLYEPLPSITFEYPNLTATVIAGELILTLTAENTPPIVTEQPTSWFTPGRLFFLGFLLMIWALLGVWFFFSFRQLT